MNITDLLLSALPKKAADGETPDIEVEIEAQFGTFMVETDDWGLPPDNDQAADADGAKNNLDADHPDLALLDKSWVIAPSLNADTDESKPKVAESLNTDKPVSRATPMMTSLAVISEPSAKSNPPAFETKTDEFVRHEPMTKAPQPLQSIPLDIATPLLAAAVTPATLVKQLQPSVSVAAAPGIKPKTEGKFIAEIADTLFQKPVRETLPREASLARAIPQENATPTNTDPSARPANTATPIASKNSQEQTVAPVLFQSLPAEQLQMPETNALAQLSVASSVAVSSVPTPIAQILHATPQRIINQVSSVITKMSDGNVEIRLDPPELGRVVVSITQTDSGVSAHITLEKPEMVDFFRRNADLFTRELARSGFENATLEFSHKERQQHDPEFENLEDIALVTETSGGSTATQTTNNVQRDGLDIRL